VKALARRLTARTTRLDATCRVGENALRRHWGVMFKRVLDNEAPNARPSAQRRAEFDGSFLEVRMFHVGQAILIVFPGNRTWLVGGGSINGPSLNRETG
jgi:hypothetical protein